MRRCTSPRLVAQVVLDGHLLDELLPALAFAWDARVLTTDSTTFGKNVGAREIRSGSPVDSIVWLFTVIALQASTLYEKPVSTRPHERRSDAVPGRGQVLLRGGHGPRRGHELEEGGGHVEPRGANPVCISAATTSLSLVYTSVPHSWRSEPGGRGDGRRGGERAGQAGDGRRGRSGFVRGRISSDSNERLVRAAGRFFLARATTRARDRRLGGK